MSRLSHIRDVLGFNATVHIPFTSQYRVRCDRCEALVVNGTPTHERGCPNATHECNGCNARVSMNMRYCYDCL